ncbi:hypothetical protein [Paeniglutamicibacter cryotolerans]|uniref:Uncharacterized protein n=1 Tax=Paeniglutamicibacter cryotolerans TaxID=670079 RepID=A0A839QQ11_9MICC|nr:hypothetical protein [Paeniglutamicibacter cryotolerans]MBB2994171.1 hypothetical protein [Paeniglutamicibacter cryotolerans]
MSRILAGLGAAALLTAMLSGCTQLVTDSGASTPEPASEPVDALPAVKPTPVPAPFTTYPARPTSKAKMESIAAELKAGRHPVDRAVPGSERVVLSKRFVGPHQFDLPALNPGEAITWSVSCLGAGQVSLEISDAGPFTSGSIISCSPNRAGGSSPASSGAGTVRIHVEPDAEVTFELIAFKEKSLFDDEEEMIALLGRMDSVEPNSVRAIADAAFIGPDELVLPQARTGTHLAAVFGCPTKALVPLRLADSGGPIPRTEYLGDCMSSEAAGTATWEDPDPLGELKLVADLEPDRVMRMRVFSYRMEAGAGG